MCNCKKSNYKKFALFLPIIPTPPPTINNPYPNPNTTIFNEIELNDSGIGSQISINKLQTSTSPLFDNLELTQKVGNTSANVTIYNFDQSLNVYDSFIDVVYRLPKGNIFISLAEPLKDYESFYGIPENKKVVVPIKYGTDHYLNVEGYVKIDTGNNTSIKKITFYIKK